LVTKKLNSFCYLFDNRLFYGKIHIKYTMYFFFFHSKRFDSWFLFLFVFVDNQIICWYTKMLWCKVCQVTISFWWHNVIVSEKLLRKKKLINIVNVYFNILSGIVPHPNYLKKKNKTYNLCLESWSKVYNLILNYIIM
jgi:hypothetical protein